jgi:hypothetical protein
MPPPNNYALPADVEVLRLPTGPLLLSDALVQLLVAARSNYEWPAGTGAAQSQQIILDLEANVDQRMQALDDESAHAIVSQVSEWAGNNAKAHTAIVQAAHNDRAKMHKALFLFTAPNDPAKAINKLSGLPGISLVIASKIFRFCCPAVGAAVDRHTSYFFNSLEVISPEGCRDRSTEFRREWSNGPDTTSRLAIYPKASYNYTRNRDECVTVYLPLLRSTASALNAIPAPYQCAVTGEQKNWRPTDVEMAAYYWGSGNGAR